MSNTEKMIKQYPFVEKVLARQLEPFGALGTKDKVTIRVEKADGDLMFKVADNIGLTDNGFMFQFEGKRVDQAGRRGEYIFAVNHSGKIINFVDWPSKKEGRSSDPVYAWNVLWGTKGSNLFGDPLFEHVAYLVWVSITAWHDHLKESEKPFGRLIDRTLDITIYGKPDCGFDELSRKSNVYENLYLDSDTLMTGVLDKNTDIMSINGHLGELCTLFQDDVYFNGMKDIIDNGGVRGASGQLGLVKVLVGEMCGYDRVSLEDGNSRAVFQLRPESKSMYVLGVGGTLPQIRRLVKSAVKAWSDPKIRQEFKADENISVM